MKVTATRNPDPDPKLRPHYYAAKLPMTASGVLREGARPPRGTPCARPGCGRPASHPIHMRPVPDF